MRKTSFLPGIDGLIGFGELFLLTNFVADLIPDAMVSAVVTSLSAQ